MIRDQRTDWERTYWQRKSNLSPRSVAQRIAPVKPGSARLRSNALLLGRRLLCGLDVVSDRSLEGNTYHRGTVRISEWDSFHPTEISYWSDRKDGPVTRVQITTGSKVFIFRPSARPVAGCAELFPRVG